jgi:gliding motility-associated-like protein
MIKNNLFSLFTLLVFSSIGQVQTFPFSTQSDYNAWAPYSSHTPGSFNYNSVVQAVQYNVNTTDYDYLLSTQVLKTQLQTQLVDNFKVSFKVRKQLSNSANSYFPLLLTQNILSGSNQHPWRVGPFNTPTLGNQQTNALLGVVFTHHQIGFVYRQHQSSSAMISYVNGFTIPVNTDLWIQIEKRCAAGYSLRVFTEPTMTTSPIVDEYYNVSLLSVPLGTMYIANCNGNGELTRHNDLLDDYKVELIQNAQVNYNYDIIPGTCTTPGQVIIQNVSGGTPPYEFSFNGSPLSSQNIFNITSEEEVLATVYDATGCSGSINIDLSGYGGTGIVSFPNVFTPDNDEVNNVWFANGSCIRNFNCTILNRWGNQITQLNAIDQSWNGKSDGKECTTGIYFYSATVEFTSGEIANYHGFIDLIR